MVVARRKYTLLLPLLLWLVSGAVSGFFIVEALHGGRGLVAKREVKSRIIELKSELADVKRMRGEWQQRVAQLRSDEADADLVDERARFTLGLASEKEVVLFMERDGASRR